MMLYLFTVLLEEIPNSLIASISPVGMVLILSGYQIGRVFVWRLRPVIWLIPSDWQ
jgi:hypothetical protein